MGEKIRTQPQKYPDYVMDGETLGTSVPHENQHLVLQKADLGFH